MKHGIIDMVSRVEGGPYYTRKQVADMVGKSSDTITRWGRMSERARPTHKMPLGKSFVWLYTEEDIATLIEFAEQQRPGKKMEWSA